MSATNTNIQAEKINFQLRAIELLDFTLNHPGHLLQELSTFHFDLNIEHKINTDKKVIFVVNNIQILNESRDFNLGSIKVNCAFEIENLMDFVDSKKNTLNLPDQTIIMLNSITISTTRGIMFSQFKGTFLHHAYLPIIDPQSFIPQIE
jgi:hypothetical protein